MSTPLVSIVTPSYNQESFITDNLESVRRQRYPNIEHIVIDGESTDGTVNILSEYESDPEYNLRWTSEPDEGQSDAINKGFDRASGDIVGWLNSDDVYFDVDAISRVVSYFQTMDADVIYGDLAYVDADSQVTEIDVRPDFDRRTLTYRSLIGQPATFFKSEAISEFRLDPEFHFCMDWDFWLRLSAEFRFQHVTDVLAGFRFHEEQKTEDQSAMEREYQRLREKHGISETTGTQSVVFDTVPSEISRTVSALRLAYSFTHEPPELAFDGEIKPFWSIASNVGPGYHDLTKSLRRWLAG